MKKKKTKGTEAKRPTTNVVVTKSIAIPKADINISLNTEAEIDAYIEAHKEWWFVGQLNNFIQRIPVLVAEKPLRLYFSMAIAKLKKQLMAKIKAEDALGRCKRTPRRVEPSKQPGDIFGPPRFFRYGEGGNSKKKSYGRGFTWRDDDY